MDKHEAEKIINAYGGAISADSKPLKHLSLLPCSKARIKYAYFVYFEAIMNEFGGISKEIGENLVGTYCMLEAFIEDELADRLNHAAAVVKAGHINDAETFNKLDPRIKNDVDEYFLRAKTAMYNKHLNDEINDYIQELMIK